MFENTANCTIYQYIKKRRLTEAARQLVYTKASIIDIAVNAGYESQQSFSSAFKKMYRKSPQEYRRNKEFWPIQLKFVNNNAIYNSKFNIRCEVKAA